METQQRSEEWIQTDRHINHFIVFFIYIAINMFSYSSSTEWTCDKQNKKYNQLPHIVSNRLLMWMMPGEIKYSSLACMCVENNNTMGMTTDSGKNWSDSIIWCWFLRAYDHIVTSTTAIYCWSGNSLSFRCVSYSLTLFCGIFFLFILKVKCTMFKVIGCELGGGFRDSDSSTVISLNWLCIQR